MGGVRTALNTAQTICAQLQISFYFFLMYFECLGGAVGDAVATEATGSVVVSELLLS